MDSTVNPQQASVQWLKEFAKTKLSQAKSVNNLCFFIKRHKNRPEKRIKIE